MEECKHGMKSGCSYCHATRTPATPARIRPEAPKRRSPSSRLADQMNDRMTALNRRLKELRGL